MLKLFHPKKNQSETINRKEKENHEPGENKSETKTKGHKNIPTEMMGDHQQGQKWPRKILNQKFQMRTFLKPQHHKQLKMCKWNQLMRTKFKTSIKRNNNKQRQFMKLTLEKQLQKEPKKTFKS